MSLPRIDLNDSNFNELVFNASKEKEGMILTGAGEKFDKSINDFSKAFDDFRMQSEEVKNAFKGEKNGMSGYFNGFHYGGKTTERYFISRDANNNLFKPLPKPKDASVSMEQASEVIVTFCAQVADKITEAIEVGLELEKRQFASYRNRSSLLAMSHYRPTTQEELQRMLENKQLTLSENGQIRSFEEHSDLSLFSILVYTENDSNGLRVKIPNENGVPVFETLNQIGDNKSQGINLLVMNGYMLEQLTKGVLKGLVHEVVTKPLSPGEKFRRNCISVFMSHDPSIDLIPLVKDAKNQSEKINFQKMFDERNAFYNAYMEREALKELPEEAKQFPKECEMITEYSEKEGISYTRAHRP